MRLRNVYETPEAVDVLYQLLAERPPEANISHRQMPSTVEHQAFIDSKPYAAWYLIDCGDYVGAIYLSHQREIGIGILRRFQGEGYAKHAILMLMERHPGRFLANVNPRNDRSISLFTGMGFKMLQNTFVYEEFQTQASLLEQRA